MSRNVLLVVAVLGALAVLGAVLLVSGDVVAPPPGTGGPGRPALSEEARELPTFAGEGGAAAAPEALAVEPDAQDVLAREHLAFEPTRLVTGRVVRLSDGAPLKVSPNFLTPTGSMMVCYAEPPGAEGDVQYWDVPVSCHALEFTLDDPEVSLQVPIEPGAEDIIGLHVVLDTGFILRGLVLDDSGSPIARAVVDVARRREGTSDDSGRFVLRDVLAEPGERVLEVRASAPWHALAATEVLVPRSSTESPFVELRLAGSGRLAGRVTWADGAPAEATQVSVEYLMAPDGESRSIDGLDTSTVEDGRYDIDHVPAGRFLVSAGRAALPPGGLPDGQPGHAPLELWIPDVDVVTGRVTTLDIVLPPPAAIAGRVLDGAGRQLAGAQVALRRIARWPAPAVQGHTISVSSRVHLETRGGDGQGQTTLRTEEAEQVTDEHGLYAFEDLAEGEREVEVRDAEGRLSPQTRTVLVRAGTRHEATDFVLVEGLTLRAQVVDAQGRPLEGASVHVAEDAAHTIGSEDFAARSDPDGWFEVRGLSPATKTLSVNLQDYAWYWAPFEPTSPPQRVVLQRALKLRGEVVDSSTGLPIEAFTLRVEFEGTSMSTDAQSHPGGLFEHDLPGDLRCTVTVGAPGYADLTLEELLPSATTLTPARFRLLHRP